MPQILSMEPLAQMLRSIALQKRSGLLYVEQLGERNAERGEIYFENGRPVRAQSGQETGRAALQKISAWKQITCSFQGMSRPFPAITRSLEPSGKPTEKRTPTPGVPEEDRRTDALRRELALAETERLKRVKLQPRGAQGSETQVLRARETESMAIARRPLATVPLRPNQPLILHGEKLEEYIPEPPGRSRPSRHIERWTTHLTPPGQEMPARPPATPRLGPLPGEEILPGRMAIFKARAMVTTAQAIQRMERRERIVFILLDGRRTIQDIARLTHQSESDVEQTLMHLTKRGFTQYIRG